MNQSHLESSHFVGVLQTGLDHQWVIGQAQTCHLQGYTKLEAQSSSSLRVSWMKVGWSMWHSARDACNEASDVAVQALATFNDVRKIEADVTVTPRNAITQSKTQNTNHGYTSRRKEKCEEGCAVHPYGSWYVPNSVSVGETAKLKGVEQARLEPDVRLSSTPFARARYFRTRSPITQRLHISRKASRSSPSTSVSTTRNALFCAETMLIYYCVP